MVRRQGKVGAKGSFNVQREIIDQHSSDAELAHRDPLHCYIIRTGKHRGHILAHICRFDEQYVRWIARDQCRNLSRQHVIRRAVDQWNAERRARGAVVPVSGTPSRFKNGKYDLYMQEKYLKKWWKVTAQELIDAGLKPKVNENTKTKAKKCSLYEVYQYVKSRGGLSTDEIELLVEEEKDRILRTRANFQSYQNGELGGEDFFDYMDFY
ncbi:hypothetical protein ACET3X_008230 [Alternaria dauci]|uniref:Uncharacterized protein n=1 Tax=Alternaria dauci TaxID=48095 RepID=A0ABR3U9R4_9PLEO